MLKLALIACVVALSTCQDPTAVPASTKHPHHTHKPHHEHTEGGHLSFHYEPKGEMIMKTGSHCYVWMLSDAQRMDVHDKMKMELLEFELAGLAKQVSTQTTFTPTHDHWIHSHCHNRITVKVAGQ